MADKKMWFRHDVGSLQDIRMQRVLRRYGMQGVGTYWCLVESLYNNNGKIFFSEVDDLAFTIHADEDLVMKIGTDHQVFESDKDGFWSNRVNEELNLQKDISDKAKKAVQIRWENQKKSKNDTADSEDTYTKSYDSNTDVIRPYKDDDTTVIHRQTDRQTEKTDKENTCPEPAENTATIETAASPSPIFIELPAIGSPKKPDKIHKVTEEDIAKYNQTYPAVDVKQELRQMSMWLEAHPSRKKSNTKAFIINWLKRSQDNSTSSDNGSTRYRDDKPRIAQSALRPNSSRGPIDPDGKTIVTDFTL